MNRLLRLALYTCLLLTVAVFSARMAGHIQPVPQSIAHLHLLDCTPPCWIGIVPGLTTVGDAKAKLVATYGGLQFKDSGFADGPVTANAVENAIEGDDFYLFVRLDISTLVDGKSEPVQSIGLFESRSDRSNYAPTVADILGTFGPPRWVIVEVLMSSGYEITLKYDGFDAVFSTYANRVALTENPYFYLANQALQTPPTGYRAWKGFSALALGK